MEKKILTKECQNCGKIFEKLKSSSMRYWETVKFCSIKCSGTLIKKGEPLPEHIKVGAREKYKKQTEQKQQGVLNNNWKGGLSWPFLKRCALDRDNYTCQSCGHNEPEIMEVDHIKPKSKFPELKLDINNLITLCPNCHRRKTNRDMRESGQNPKLQLLTQGF